MAKKEEDVIIRIRAIAKCKVAKKDYQPGIFIDDISEAETEKGLKAGYLAEIPFVKVGKKQKRK